MASKPSPQSSTLDLAVSFGTLGHFLPAEGPALFAGVYRALRPGGVFAFPIGTPQPITSSWYWALLGVDLTMRVRATVTEVTSLLGPPRRRH